MVSTTEKRNPLSRRDLLVILLHRAKGIQDAKNVILQGKDPRRFSRVTELVNELVDIFETELSETPE